jgi:hypothetical protein
MSYWDLSNRIESISYRIESIKSIIELVAENISDNAYSSPLWGCAEMLEIYSKRLEDLSAEAMEFNKIEKEDVKEEERMWVDPELGLIATFKEKIKKGKKK